MKRFIPILRRAALAVLVAIAIYAVSAADWLRAVALVALLVLLAGCASPPPQLPPSAVAVSQAACPPLPLPKGKARAARDAHALLVIRLYGQCAATRNAE